MLARAAEKYADSISFYGVVSGPDDRVDDEKMRAIVRRTGVGYPQVRDRDLSLAERFGVRAVPTILVIAPDRKIAYRNSRPPDEWSH